MEANELIKLYDQADIADWFGNEPLLKRESRTKHRINKKHRVIFTSLITGLLVAGTMGLITFLIKRKR
jgi:hypothetical protein